MPIRQSKGDRIQYFAMNVLSAFLLVTAVLALVNRQFEAAALAILALLSRFLPGLLERHYKINLPIELHVAVYVFMFASVFLGSASDVYAVFWWWDVALHFASGLGASFGAFLFLYTLHAQNRMQMTPLAAAFFTLCAGVTIGALWEVSEYLADNFLGATSQNGDLQDTMQDLVFDSLGALLVSVAGYFYLKRAEAKRNPIKRLVTNFEHHNPQLFNKKSRR